MPGGDRLRADALVVEVVERVVVDEDVAPAGAVLEFLDVFQECAVGVEELVLGLPFALHQGMADEQVPGRLGSMVL